MRIIGKEQREKILMAILKRAVLCGAVAVVLSITSAHAAIVITPNPPGNVNNPNNGDVYKSNAHFINPGVLDDYYADTLISKTFGPGVSTIAFNVSFLGSDLDFAGGLRWTESIKNDTGLALTSLVLTLSETASTFFADTVFSPAFVDITFPGGVTTIERLNSVGTAVRSNSNKTLTFTFNTPLPSGVRFGIHAPIEGLPTDGGSFQLSQTVSAVPEASSVLVMGLGCVVAVGAVVVGRRYGVSFNV